MSKAKLTEFQLLDLISTYESSVSKLKFQINDFESTLKTLKADLKEVRAAAKAAAKKAPAKKAPIKKAAAPAAKKTATAPVKKTAGRRGRPRKNPVAAATTKKVEAPKAEAPVAKKPAGRRGRPRKNPIAATNGAAKTPTKTKIAAKAKAAVKKAPVKKAPAKKAPAKKVVAKAPANDNDKGYKLSDWDQLVLTSVKSANRVLTRSELDTLINKKGGSLKKGLEAKQINAKVSNVLHKLTNKRGILKKDKNADNKTGYTLA